MMLAWRASARRRYNFGGLVSLHQQPWERREPVGDGQRRSGRRGRQQSREHQAVGASKAQELECFGLAQKSERAKQRGASRAATQRRQQSHRLRALGGGFGIECAPGGFATRKRVEAR